MDKKTLERVRQLIIQERLADLEGKVKGTNQRITVVKEYLEDEMEKTVDRKEETKNKLEELCQVPKDLRKENSSKKTYRATLIWENFSEWSEFTKRGRVLESGELKKLLNIICDEDIQYSQVHRAMDEFNQRTGEEYSIINDNKKKIIKRS